MGKNIEKDIIDALAKVLKEHNLSEIEYEKDDDFRVKIVKNKPQTLVSAPATNNTTQNDNSNTGEKAEVSYDSHPGAVKSPMVGSFYSASDPKSNPFVNEGDSVKKGDKLCLIEAMKTFNPITAPKDGIVKTILKQDGDAVEFDETIMIIE